ncbi:Amino-transferase class IV [uncultured archaeon]|nr:Amino-transferase class IV [uncultured archaeon]
MNETDFIWVNGKMVKWQDATTHVLTHSLHYGSGVFEGIRCYETSKGPAVFRLKEHIKRFFESAKLISIKVPYTQEQIIETVKEIVKVNKLKECYIRPITYYGYGKMGLDTKGAKVDVVVAAWPWGAYLGEDGLKNGIRAKISSYRRPHPKSVPIHAKTTGVYVNSTLAKMEALGEGFEEAVMLDYKGNVAECSGENIFIVKNGVLITPPLDLCLAGITRDSVIELAKKRGINVIEKAFQKEELLAADECFITGTAAEITPVREIDNTKIGTGTAGKITAMIQEEYKKVIHGNNKDYLKWLELI